MHSSKNIFSQLLKTGSKNKLWSRPLYQFSSVTQSCTTLCDLMDCSMLGLPVHQQLLELTQTHIHWVGDAFNHLILCHTLLLPSTFPSIQVFPNESILPIRWPKYWSFSFNINSSNDIQDWFSLGWTGWISLQSRGLSRVFSNTTVQKHQFFGAQLSLWSNSHSHTWLLEKPYLVTVAMKLKGPSVTTSK